MRWAAVSCTDLWRRGGVGGPVTGCPHRGARSSRACISLCRNCRRSEMLDLRRFPVSDGAGVKCCTFRTILDRKQKFEISNNGFFVSGHVTPEDMEMSEITLRIEWKHFQIPAGPASGRNCTLKCRNHGFGHHGTFFQSSGKFEKWEKDFFLLAWQSKLFLGGWNRFGVNRWPGGRAMSGKRPSPTRRTRVSRISLAGYPIFDLARFGL